jgi:hypothetical protein
MSAEALVAITAVGTGEDDGEEAEPEGPTGDQGSKPDSPA